MQSTLQQLARLYQLSASSRKASLRDYTIDYEKFLRASGMEDGDEREIAECDLRLAETTSSGLLRIDRHRRTGAPEKLRLSRSGGEQWLYAQLEVTPPSQQRIDLSNYFLTIAAQTVPPQWQQPWCDWFRQLSASALNGDSIQPFRRDDPQGNRILINALSGILHWQSPALIRYASTAICANSKLLQQLEPRLRIALTAITGSDSLENFGILRKPRFVTFHGPLSLRIDIQVTDFAMFPGPVTLAETNLTSQAILSTNASICLTVENEDTFHELAATNPGVLLIHTSFAGAAVRRMMSLLPPNLSFFHFGDNDPAGADILRDLRDKTGRDIHPLIIPGHDQLKRYELSNTDRNTLLRLLDTEIPAALRTQVETLLEKGIPSDYEQESIPIPEVWKALHALQLTK
jgi:hypothetical protein